MKYLVPIDFTEITENALAHALLLAKADGGTVDLLHIIKSEEDRSEAMQKFESLMDTLNEEEKEKVQVRVRQGDIFKDIAREANEGSYKFLVMGTHGARGMQKLWGSNAIRVITSSNTPFVVTQKEGPRGSINNIVLPVDLSNERLQIVRFASELALKFKAQIHLVHAHQSDEFLIKRIKNNIKKVKSALAKKEISYTLTSVEPQKDWATTVQNFGKKKAADMFAIGYYPDTILPQFETFSQEMITNKAGIPVLIANVDEVEGVNSNYSFVGI